jgi:hypothetical protein
MRAKATIIDVTDAVKANEGFFMVAASAAQLSRYSIADIAHFLEYGLIEICSAENLIACRAAVESAKLKRKEQHEKG